MSGMFLSRVKYVPVELLGTFLATLGILAVVITSTPTETVLRTIVALPIFFFLPGYVFVIALFPESSIDVPSSKAEPKTISRYEHIILAICGSIVLVTVTGGLLYLFFDPSIKNTVQSVSAVVVVEVVVAAKRQLALSPEARRGTSAYLIGQFLIGTPKVKRSKPVDALVLLLFFVAISGITYAAIDSRPADSGAEFFIPTGNASTVSTDFVSGEQTEGTIGVSNNGDESVRYSIVVELHRVEETNGTVHTLGVEHLDQFEQEVPAGQTIRRSHQFTPTMVGDQLRLTYFLYRGASPVSPGIENSHRSTFLKVSVESNEG